MTESQFLEAGYWEGDTFQGVAVFTLTIKKVYQQKCEVLNSEILTTKLLLKDTFKDTF